VWQPSHKRTCRVASAGRIAEATVYVWKDSTLKFTRLGCIHTLFITNYAWVSGTKWSYHITVVSQDWHYCNTLTQSWLSLLRFLTKNFGSCCMPVIVSNRVPSWGLLSNLPCDSYPKHIAASSACLLMLITKCHWVVFSIALLKEWYFCNVFYHSKFNPGGCNWPFASLPITLGKG
jgi:hypothetical protein